MVEKKLLKILWYAVGLADNINNNNNNNFHDNNTNINSTGYFPFIAHPVTFWNSIYKMTIIVIIKIIMIIIND